MITSLVMKIRFPADKPVGYLYAQDATGVDETPVGLAQGEFKTQRNLVLRIFRDSCKDLSWLESESRAPITTIEGNRFSPPSVAALSCLTNLRCLRLYCTLITEEHLATLQNLPQLNSLELFGCTFNSGAAKTVSIKRFSYNGAPFDPTIMSQLLNSSRLEELDISFNASGNDTELFNQVMKNILDINSDLSHLSLSATGCTVQTLKSLSDLSRLQSLSLSEAGITNQIGRILCESINLTTLKLEGSALIDDQIFPMLKDMKNLEALSLVQTGIQGKSFECLETIPALRTLNCSFSDFSEYGLRNFPALPGLTELTMAVARIPANSIDSLSQLQNLERLNLSFNDLTFEDLNRLNKLTRLKEVDLSRLPIAFATLPGLLCQSAVEKISFAYTEAQDSVCTFLAAVPNLTELDLTGTRITAGSLHGLKALTQLRVLRLGENSSFSKDGRSCRFPPRLEELSVSAHWLSQSSLQELSKLPKLKVLKLEVAEISDEALSFLAEFEHLQELDLDQARNLKGDFLKYLPASLITLAIRHSKIEDSSLQALCKLVNLHDLWLDSRVISGGAVELTRLVALRSLRLLGLNVESIHAALNQKLDLDFAEVRNIY